MGERYSEGRRERDIVHAGQIERDSEGRGGEIRKK